MILTLPNALTLARLLAAPALVLPFAFLPRPTADLWALAIFLAAAVTDFLDGWLARRLNQQSRLGAVLDPIADKALVVIGLAVAVPIAAMPVQMADVGPAPGRSEQEFQWLAPALDPTIALPVALILFREIFVSGLREACGPDAGLAVTRLAKWKTVAQVLAIATLLGEQRVLSYLTAASQRDPPWLFGAIPWPADAFIGTYLLWAAAVLTLITGWDYATKAIAYISRREDR
ncbi:MAG: CDP-alcohol phosphatidyltransferase family protein [Pikeienuella sp.]